MHEIQPDSAQIHRRSLQHGQKVLHGRFVHVCKRLDGSRCHLPRLDPGRVRLPSRPTHLRMHSSHRPLRSLVLMSRMFSLTAQSPIYQWCRSPWTDRGKWHLDPYSRGKCMWCLCLGHRLWSLAFFCYTFNKLTYLLGTEVGLVPSDIVLDRSMPLGESSDARQHDAAREQCHYWPRRGWLKAKFHYASWLGASSKHVRS